MLRRMNALRIAVLSSAAVLISSCSRADAATPRLCEDAYLSIAKGLAKSFDYAELRNTSQPGERETAGEKCKTAKKREACLQAVEKANSATGWNNGSHGRRPGHVYAVATRGDDVVVITQDNIASALGTIDTPVKAALVAGIKQGLMPKCDGAVREVKGGFEVHLESDSCFGSVDDVVLVDSKGELEVVSSKHGIARCVGSLERVAQPLL